MTLLWFILFFPVIIALIITALVTWNDGPETTLHEIGGVFTGALLLIVMSFPIFVYLTWRKRR